MDYLYLAYVHNLYDVVISRQGIRANVQMDVLVSTHEVLGELLDFLGPSGGPHQHLAIGTNLTQNLSDLRLEAHIQHSISFVQDHVGTATEIDLPHLK